MWVIFCFFLFFLFRETIHYVYPSLLLFTRPSPLPTPIPSYPSLPMPLPSPLPPPYLPSLRDLDVLDPRRHDLLAGAFGRQHHRRAEHVAAEFRAEVPVEARRRRELA